MLILNSQLIYNILQITKLRSIIYVKDLNYISYLFYYFYNECKFTYSMLYIINFKGECYSLANMLYIIYFIKYK